MEICIFPMDTRIRPSAVSQIARYQPSKWVLTAHFGPARWVVCGCKPLATQFGAPLEQSALETAIKPLRSLSFRSPGSHPS